MRLQVTDDSGFLALVDPDAYEGFVGADWGSSDLLHRFREQMAARRLLIWGTGQEGCWTVQVAFSHNRVSGAREVFGSIVSTKGRLLLTNYESLTMAAEDSHATLPERHQADLVFDIEPGTYRCRIVQYPLQASGWQEGCPPEFSVELEPTAVLDPSWQRIPWAGELV